MKNPRLIRAVGLLCFVTLAAVATAGGDSAKIEGTWNFSSAISRGKKVPQAEIEKAKGQFTFKDGKYKATMNGEEMETGTYKVDTSKQPATIDMLVSEGSKSRRKQPGIYKIEGDTLTLVITVTIRTASSSGKAAKAPTLPRPKDFEGKDKNHEVMVFKRGN